MLAVKGEGVEKYQGGTFPRREPKIKGTAGSLLTP